MKHVAVLMGGWSSEREVSIKSGRACAQSLKHQGFGVTELHVTPTITKDLQEIRPDVALNALHGPIGEDGRIQGLLELLGIPYTHSGVLASALAMNKAKAKEVMQASGIAVADGKVMCRFDLAREHVLSVPYVVKPVAEGSSFGVTVVTDPNVPPPDHIAGADWPYGNDVLVERYISGIELTCAVMGDKALDVMEIKPISSVVADYNSKTKTFRDYKYGQEFYDYHAKYDKGAAIHEIPADIDWDVYSKIQEWALIAHKAIGCRGVTRTDFRYDNTPAGTGEIVALEINTQPGMTETSLVPEIAAHAGISFDELVRWMLDDASQNR
ncbi:D-alanine--D-alanine ligase [Phyllobacterium phragmitis]|uniref:D-alanine--D-alanine ligase n=1 Tax=Phyllobacterium phragmitis TaxID=2670329 RepID=A0A2S9IKT3_9HYPH|nr:D-alanine--D-alanine ligase [Phyllobacterium phragmitis]PRD41130.1 D-alanine--D-alanine ligase [Phyllobacterium phragmitis]